MHKRLKFMATHTFTGGQWMKLRADNPDAISWTKNELRKRVWGMATDHQMTLDGEPHIEVEVNEILGVVTVRAEGTSL